MFRAAWYRGFIMKTLLALCLLVSAQSPAPTPSPASVSPGTPPSPGVTLPVPAPAPVPPGQLAYPQGIVLDAKGDLLVSDKDASAIFRIGAADKKVTLVAQWSPELKKAAAGPWIHSNFQGMLLEADGSIVTPDPSARSLWRVSPAGEIKLIVQDFQHFMTPQGITSDGAGNYVIADPHLHGIVKVTKDGKASYLVETDLTTLKPLRNPRGIARDKDGSYVVADGSLRGVFRVSADGKVTPIVQGDPFKFPQGITIDADGSFLVPDNYARAVFRVTGDKVAPLVQGEPLKNPRNIVPDGKGGYYLTDPGIPAILKVDAAGKTEVWLPIQRPDAK
jgi:streptogramin lyase